LDGRGDRHNSVVDEGGVALAAIQGLNRKLTEELKRRDEENAELRRRLEALERSLGEKR
jgi:predicted nuclease with TOPRIM domain